MEDIWRVYVRMPTKDFQNPMVEYEFYHTNEKLCEAVFESLLIQELQDFFEAVIF